MKISNLLDRENNNLDLIRIVLACFVIIGHSPTLNGPSDFWVDPIGHFFQFTYSGALAVKLFFFISGLVVTNSIIKQRDPIQFVISRFFRVFPALLFVLLITVFIVGPIVTDMELKEYFSSLDQFHYIQNNIMLKTEYTLPGLFNGNLYKGAVNGSLWSLTFEAGCYIALLGFFLLLKDAEKKYWNCVIAIIVIDTFLPHRIIFGWLGDNPEINLLPISFALGAFFAINADKIEINLSMVFGMMLIFYLFDKTDFAQTILVITSCIILLYVASNTLVLKLKPAYDVSYGVYLWGFLIQQTIYHFLGHVYVGLHAFLAIACSLILALVTNILVERPFIALGKYTGKVLKDRF